MRRFHIPISGLGLAVLLFAAPPSPARGVPERLDAMLAEIPADRIPTGILYDRVVGFSRIADHDGSDASRPVTPAEWRRMYDEILRAARPIDPSWPVLDALRQRAAGAPAGEVPLAILNFRYARIRPDALETGALIARDGQLYLGTGLAFDERRVFAAAPLRGHTYRGEQIRFRLDRADYLGNDPAAPVSIEIDFDDGGGFVLLGLDGARTVRYAAPGTKTIRLRLALADGTRLEAAALFEVRGLRTPAPNDTLHITATIPYKGGTASGDAYVYLADTHTTLTEPVVVLEGFDLDNSMDWDELYALLNRENLLETLRADGFDAVVLNFTDATDYIQRNAFVAARADPAGRGRDRDRRKTIAVAGASMGGLVGRYALAYMETHGLDRTRCGPSSPSIRRRPARTSRSGSSTGSGSSPTSPRTRPPARRRSIPRRRGSCSSTTTPTRPAARARATRCARRCSWRNWRRSGTGRRRRAWWRSRTAAARGHGQGFNPGDQIIRWEYTSLLVDITGNVWAVPDGTSQLIFHGLIDYHPAAAGRGPR